MPDTMNIGNSQHQDYAIDAATHFLHCRHCYGLGKEKDYWMPCILLNTVGEDRAKVMVFGDRFWRGREHVKRVRYVEASRLVIIGG